MSFIIYVLDEFLMTPSLLLKNRIINKLFFFLAHFFEEITLRRIWRPSQRESHKFCPNYHQVPPNYLLNTYFSSSLMNDFNLLFYPFYNHKLFLIEAFLLRIWAGVCTIHYEYYITSHKKTLLSKISSLFFLDFFLLFSMMNDNLIS